MIVSRPLDASPALRRSTRSFRLRRGTAHPSGYDSSARGRLTYGGPRSPGGRAGLPRRGAERPVAELFHKPCVLELGHMRKQILRRRPAPRASDRYPPCPECRGRRSQVLGIFEIMQNGEVLPRPTQLVLRVACNSAYVGSLSSCNESTSSSIMPGLVIRISDKYGLAARKLDVQVQRWRMRPQQIPQHSLAAERIADPSEVVERAVRVGRGADRAETAAICLPTDAGSGAGKKRYLFRGQVAQSGEHASGCWNPNGASTARSLLPAAGWSSRSTSRGAGGSSAKAEVRSLCSVCQVLSSRCFRAARKAAVLPVCPKASAIWAMTASSFGRAPTAGPT